MAILSKESLLGATDLTEREVDLPSIGGSVRIRSLPAAYSNMANSAAVKMVTVEHRGRQEQTSQFDAQKVEEMKVLHALLEPKLASIEEVQSFSQRCGAAWHTLVKAIDEISGIDEQAVEKTNALFRSGGGVQPPAGPAVEDAARTGNGRSDLPVSVGV